MCEDALTVRSLKQSFMVAAIVSVVFILMKTTETGRTAVENVWGLALAPLRWLSGDWNVRPINIVRDTSDVIAVPMAFLAIVYTRKRWQKLSRRSTSDEEIFTL